ncbi:MAG TPA: hypothetical protein DEA94_10625 [Rhodobacteraceae bacterium]|nr:hypothetical protein [Paracoccaceae bacterium]
MRQVCLTKKGPDVFRSTWPVMSQTSDTLSEVLIEEEKRIFQDVLMRILDNVRVTPYQEPLGLKPLRYSAFWVLKAPWDNGNHKCPRYFLLGWCIACG